MKNKHRELLPEGAILSQTPGIYGSTYMLAHHDVNKIDGHEITIGTGQQQQRIYVKYFPNQVKAHTWWQLRRIELRSAAQQKHLRELQTNAG